MALRPERSPGKLRKRKHPSPTPGFLVETIEPFEMEFLPEFRGTSFDTSPHVKTTTQANPSAVGTKVTMFPNPKFLLRYAQTGEN
jgi:hypothetical protein